MGNHPRISNEKEYRMKRKYFPRNDADLLIWMQNLREQIATYATAVGLDAAAKKSVLDQSGQLVTAIEADEKAYVAYRTAARRGGSVASCG
jgi:hypothetical protein